MPGRIVVQFVPHAGLLFAVRIVWRWLVAFFVLLSAVLPEVLPVA